MNKRSDKKIRYGVVGLGNIAQMAVLPAFAHATENSELVALVSSDAEKLSVLAKRYEVSITGSYDDLDRLLRSGDIDAIYTKCILEDVDPEPAGEEGMSDVRILEAIVGFAALGRRITLTPFERTQRPSGALEMRSRRQPKWSRSTHRHPVSESSPLTHAGHEHA